MNLFFLNVGRRCELVEAFAKALCAVSPGLVWGSDPNPLAPALAVVDRIAPLPAQLDDDAFVDALVDFLVRERIDLLVPTIDPDLVRLDRWRATLARRAPDTRLLLSPSRVIDIARDKRKSREAFAALGAEVPRAVDPADPALRFPVFIKPAAGSASMGAMRIDDRDTLSRALVVTTDPMVEELVDGDETTVDVLLDFEAKPLKAVPRRRLQVRGGEVTRGVLEASAELEALALRLASGLGCIGPVTLQFRQPAPGRWVAMELNARMGGGLPLAIAAGADWPRWILELCKGRRPATEVTVVDRLCLSRYDRSLFVPPEGALPPRWQGQKALPSLLVFDLDDTLFPESDFVRSGHRAAAEAAWRDHRIDIEPELRRRFALGQRGDLFTAAFSTLGLQVPEDYIRRVLVPAYREHRPEIRPYAEARDVLSQLGQSGHRLALLSDGWSAVQRRKFEALGLDDLFDAVMFTDELGRDAWKPSTRGFQALLDRLGVLPADAGYIGDNPVKDFIGPHALGMSSFRLIRPGIEHGDVLARPREADAQWRIGSLADLCR